jgi:virginiamycin B lyase
VGGGARSLRWLRALIVGAACAAAVVGGPGVAAAARFPLNQPTAITAGPDGRLWVADSQGIVAVTTRGRMARVATVSGVISIVMGPDGALWFTAHSPARIGRLTTGGAITYFTAGIGGQPHWIARGADGNLWFTENAATAGGRTAIGRITQDGTVTEFSQGLMTTRQDQGFLDHITSGPDGNMWFTDGLRAVGRITPAGEISEYPLPQPFADYREAIGITAGADHALWFGDGDRIGRIGTSGRMSFYKDPWFEVDDLVLGRDGNVWMTHSNDYDNGIVTIARITPRGKLKIVGRGLTGIEPGGLAVGPDGNLWVTEQGRTGDHVARIHAGTAREFPAPLPCRVPHLKRLPLIDVHDRLFNALCTLDPSSAPAGRRSGTVALGVHPHPGTVLPYGAKVRVDFGPVPPLPKRCALPFAAQRLRETPRVLVFSYSNFAEHEESSTTYGACLRPHGPLHLLQHAVDELLQYSTASLFQVAGPYVAWAFFYEDHYNSGSAKVRVVDLRTAKTLGQWQQGWDPECGATNVIALQLTRAGSAVWTDGVTGGDQYCVPPANQVWKVEAHARPVLLDSAGTVDPHSLTVTGHTVTWRDGGAMRTASVR